MAKAPKKQRPGRPATGETPKQYFRMSNEDFGRVRKAAQDCGENTSVYIRRVLMESLDDRRKKK